MIKINELRQGNLVMLKGEVTSWDWSLVGEGANTFYKSTGSEVAVDPVALTEEWLIKFGAEHKGYFNGYVIWIDSAALAIKDGAAWFGGVFMCKVSFIHQLQNLYFAIASDELNLKEPI